MIAWHLNGLSLGTEHTFIVKGYNLLWGRGGTPLFFFPLCFLVEGTFYLVHSSCYFICYSMSLKKMTWRRSVMRGVRITRITFNFWQVLVGCFMATCISTFLLMMMITWHLKGLSLGIEHTFIVKGYSLLWGRVKWFDRTVSWNRVHFHCKRGCLLGQS